MHGAGVPETRNIYCATQNIVGRLVDWVSTVLQIIVPTTAYILSPCMLDMLLKFRPSVH